MVKFSERLRKLRTDKELSQAKLAIALETRQQTIDKWERGLTEPDMATIMRIAVIFDVTSDYLLGLSNNMSHEETVATINNGINTGTIIGGKNNRLTKK